MAGVFADAGAAVGASPGAKGPFGVTVTAGLAVGVAAGVAAGVTEGVGTAGMGPAGVGLIGMVWFLQLAMDGLLKKSDTAADAVAVAVALPPPHDVMVAADDAYAAASK